MSILNNRVTKMEESVGLLEDLRGVGCGTSRGRRHCGEGQRGRYVRFRRRAAAASAGRT